MRRLEDFETLDNGSVIIDNGLYRQNYDVDVIHEPVYEPSVIVEPIRHYEIPVEPVYEPSVIVEPIRHYELPVEPVYEPPVIVEPIRHYDLPVEPVYEPPVIVEPIRHYEIPVEPVYEPPVIVEPIRHYEIPVEPVYEPSVIVEPIRHYNLPVEPIIDLPTVEPILQPLMVAPTIDNLIIDEMRLIEPFATVDNLDVLDVGLSDNNDLSIREMSIESIYTASPVNEVYQLDVFEPSTTVPLAVETSVINTDFNTLTNKSEVKTILTVLGLLSSLITIYIFLKRK